MNLGGHKPLPLQTHIRLCWPNGGRIAWWPGPPPGGSRLILHLSFMRFRLQPEPQVSTLNA